MRTHICTLARLISLGFPHFSRAMKAAACQTHAEVQQGEREYHFARCKLPQTFKQLDFYRVIVDEGAARVNYRA